MPGLLSPIDLADIAAEVAATFDQTCSVVMSRPMPDGSGGTTTVDTVVASGPCMVLDAGTASREGVFADRVASSDDRTILMAPGTPVTNGSRIVSDGVTYDIAHVASDTSYLAVLRIDARVRA